MAKEKNKGKKRTVATAKKIPAKGIKKPAKSKTVKPAKKTAKPSKKAAPDRKPKKKGDTLMCFLTTACVNYYSLPDNGYELNTLRNYRDSYLAASTEGKNLIDHYYKISPEIVKRVDEDKNKKRVYAYIYSVIKTACAEIENKDLAGAKKTYSGMVNRLKKRYHLD